MAELNNRLTFTLNNKEFQIVIDIERSLKFCKFLPICFKVSTHARAERPSCSSSGGRTPGRWSDRPGAGKTHNRSPTT